MSKEINDEMHFAIDVPPSYPDRWGSFEEWINVEYFKTKEDAIKFAMEHFGADENGNINIISTF